MMAKHNRNITSAAGLAAAEKFLGRSEMERLARMGILGSYLESLSHPWIARYSKTQGWVSCHDPNLTLESVTGHVDHAPYALTSQSGPSQPMPFEGERGQLYFVKWTRRVKAIHIAGQVENSLRKLFVAKNTWLPRPFGRALDACGFLRAGLAALEERDRNPVCRARDIQEGQEALAVLRGELSHELMNWRGFTANERELVRTALARLDPLQDLLVDAAVPA